MNVKKILVRLSLFTVVSGVIGAIIVGCVIMYFSMELPKISSLDDYRPPMPSKILAKDGTVLATIGKQKRDVVKMEDIPKRIIDAFLSAEDDNFYEHKGVDYLGVLRAMYINVLAGRVVQGGSTITQQVAKSLLLTRERSIARKIKDFLLAQRIEKKLSKSEILYLYLNQVYFGGGYYGVKSAIKGYFGKELSEATVAEVAMIAGLLVAPGKYSPYINPQFAKKRQQYVLSRMFNTGKITEVEYKEALNEKIKYQLKRSNDFRAGYFTDWVRQRAVEFFGEDDFLEQSYTIKTTLDWKLQHLAEQEVFKGAKQIDKRQGFKGPIKSLENLDSIWENNKKYRIDKYKDESLYFVLGENHEREYELIFNDEEIENIRQYRLEWEEKFKTKSFLAGNLKDDPLLNFIQVNESYEAEVIHLDNRNQLIYVNIGGLTGVIPYKFYRWAHERKIEHVRNYFPYVKRPNEIVNIGDVILVEVFDKSEKFSRIISDDTRKALRKNKKLRPILSETFLECALDQYPDVQAALFSVHPQDGHVLSLVGGIDFSKSQFNRALQSLRQPGSSFKPLLYAAGLEHGFTPASILIDSPEALGGVDATLNWKPGNYDGKFKGPMTFRNALEVSRNIPTIKVAEKIGVDNIIGFMDRIGFKADLDRDLSLALGSFGVTLLDIVKTYAVFPNGGNIVDINSITSITDREGRQIDFIENFKEGGKLYTREDYVQMLAKKEEERLALLEKEKEKEADQSSEEIIEMAENESGNKEETKEDSKEEENIFTKNLTEKQVYDRRLAYLMTNLLKGVVQNGTGKGARKVSPYIGGKTGTTNNFVDAWFVGFSSNVATGVWTGFDDNQTMGYGETGGRSALPIWAKYMEESIKVFGESDFNSPSGIINVKINKETGKLSTSGLGFVEAFVDGTEPSNSSDVQEIDESTMSEINDENLKSDFIDEEDYFNNQ